MTTQQRIRRVVWIVLAVAAAGVVYYLLYRFLGFGIPCTFYQLTGLSCPGCGLTRAITALLSGDVASALSYNPMLPLYALYSAWFVGCVIVRYVKGERDVMLVGPTWLHIVMLVVLVTFGVVRNLI